MQPRSSQPNSCKASQELPLPNLCSPRDRMTRKEEKDLELRLLLEGFIFIFRCLGFCCKMNELQRNLNLYVCKINFSFLG